MSENLSGAEEEIAFWRGAFARFKSDPGKSVIGAKLDKQRPLQAEIAQRIAIALPKGQKTARVLDVGCGPLSTIGKHADSFSVEITGLDPLADAYQSLIEEAGLESPHKSVAGFAENATDHFGEGAFEYVHSENSLDHCQDAARALSQLQKASRPDAVFFFRVFVNEGEHNHYSGFHQWNFDTYNDSVIYWRPGQIHFMDELFKLPVRFWYDEGAHGPDGIQRRFLNVEVHNTDLEKGFQPVGGGVEVRYLPRYSSLVLKRADGYQTQARSFAHFSFEDGPRQVASLIWPSDEDHHVLKIPDGLLKAIKLGHFTKTVLPDGKMETAEVWSGFVNLAKAG